jgi:hypothetical protein
MVDQKHVNCFYSRTHLNIYHFVPEKTQSTKHIVQAQKEEEEEKLTLQEINTKKSSSK